MTQAFSHIRVLTAILVLMVVSGYYTTSYAQTSMETAQSNEQSPQSLIENKSVMEGPSLPDSSVVELKDEYKKAVNIHPSLIYSPEEIQDIRLAAITYRKHFKGGNKDGEFNEEDFLNQLTGMRKAKKAAARFTTYPQFFLESLVYHSPEDWVVWLSDNVRMMKLTPNTPRDEGEISVISVKQDSVKLQWRPDAIERVLEIWCKIPNQETLVDPTLGTVTFTLRHNQTFSSFVMRVLEGKVAPVSADAQITEELKPGEITAKKETSTPSTPNNSEPAKDTRKEGLVGLIGSYSNIGKETTPPPLPAIVPDTPPTLPPTN